MKKLFYALTFLVIFTITASHADARDTTHHLSIKKAINSADGKKALNPKIRLHFAKQKSISVRKTIGKYVTNKKTNSVFKTDETSCNWVFLSALKALQARAVKQGGNAVINIESYYKRKPYRSASKFECHAGATISGVALRGTVVKR